MKAMLTPWRDDKWGLSRDYYCWDPSIISYQTTLECLGCVFLSEGPKGCRFLGQRARVQPKIAIELLASVAVPAGLLAFNDLLL